MQGGEGGGAEKNVVNMAFVRHGGEEKSSEVACHDPKKSSFFVKRFRRNKLCRETFSERILCRVLATRRVQVNTSTHPYPSTTRATEWQSKHTVIPYNAPIQYLLSHRAFARQGEDRRDLHQ